MEKQGAIRGCFLGKILVLDNLRKCGLIVMDWCYITKKCGETRVDYLLFHCEVARVFSYEGFIGLEWRG